MSGNNRIRTNLEPNTLRIPVQRKHSSVCYVNILNKKKLFEIKKTGFQRILFVEMAGVEPASERIDPRIYYERSSFIDFAWLRRKEQYLYTLFTRTRKPSFVPCRDFMDSILTLCRLLCDRSGKRCRQT